MNNGGVMKPVVRRSVILAVVSFALILAATYFLIFGAPHASSLSAEQRAGEADITAEVQRISVAENPTFGDFIELAKRGGKVTTCAIFYNDMWTDPDPTPYSLLVEYKEGIKIEIHNSDSLSGLYKKFYSTLVSIHKIEGEAK